VTRVTKLALWAGVECSVVRVRDAYVDELLSTGHAARADDVDHLARLGVSAVRYPVLWERTVPVEGGAPDWAFPDERLGRLRDLGVTPIVGLVHHGSGPRHTSLLDESFASGLARFARSVAERYPWVTDYTPVNEPLTTARFSALYGHWYPHARSDAAFVRALLVQCRAIRAAMRAIRDVVPGARLVQTEDLGTVSATPALADQARFENGRRLWSLDLLTGRIDARHRARDWLLGVGASKDELDDFVAAPCPPDVIGLNHYVTSDRFLDERVALYPAGARGGNGRLAYADVEAVRVRGAGVSSHRSLLELLWRRYALPLAITEVHLGGAPEEQVRWLHDAWNGAAAARARGADVRAVTVWSAFGACDWDSLLVAPRGRYEPGIFDVRGARARPTALAGAAADLAARGAITHPLVSAPGWWRRADRVIYPTFGRSAKAATATAAPAVVVTGAGGTVGREVIRVCRARGLPVVALERRRLDVTDRAAIAAALDAHRPWAVLNAAGYVRVDDAEGDRDACFRVNADGAAALAEACARRGVRYATFSSDLVFDGAKTAPYVESDGPSPLNVVGRSKAAAEQRVLEIFPDAIVARTSALFGRWGESSFVERVIRELSSGASFGATADVVVSPTYVPDLADAIVTLLVDGASGVWHLASSGAVTRLELAVAAAKHAGLDADRVMGCTSGELGRAARRPRYSALATERGGLMRPLDEALAVFSHELRRDGVTLRPAGDRKPGATPPAHGLHELLCR